MSDKKYRTNSNGILVGLIVLAIGSLLLLEKMHLLILPYWLFSWEVILIVLGFLIGARKGFRTGGWMVMMLVGGIFLAQEVDFFGLDIREYLWPIVLIIIGFFFVMRSIFSSNRTFDWEKYAPKWDETKKQWEEWQRDKTKGEFVEATAIVSGIKRRVFSKEFAGGDVTCFMGSAEIDLSQADITETAVIDVSLVFGGLKLFVPSNWDVQSEVTAVFGGVVDKRIQNTTAGPLAKRLILTGACVFGGIEIKSF